MNSEPSATARRVAGRYTRDMIVASLLYSGVVIGCALAIDTYELPQWTIICFAVAPLLPALLMLRAYVVFLSGVDEFQRRVQTDAIVVAAAFVGFGSFTYGFLEEWAGFPHLPLIWVLPALIGAWGIAACVLRMRYK